MMAQRTFRAEIEAGRHGGAFVAIPFDVQQTYGQKGQVKVKATFDGQVYRGSIAPMGNGSHILGVTKTIRKSIGKDVGDTVHVVLQRDTEERTVTLPAALDKALRAAGVAQRFNTLSFTRRREYAQSVADAKKDATRERRIAKIVDELGGA